jgi:prepilin-type N-terminal cleavage/methylation domain-containing protein
MKTVPWMCCQRAFSLLEVIVSLVVVGIVAAMMIPFLGTALTRSAESVISAQQHASLNKVIENITADFKRLSNLAITGQVADPLGTLSSSLGTEGSDMSNAYGSYHVVTNHTISFPSGSSVTETADANGDVLKVKISYQGYTLTALFTK